MESPDYTPYSLEKNDSRVYDAEKSMKRFNKTIDWRKIEKGPDMDDETIEREEHTKK